MNKELFRSMQEQMRPSGEARNALAERLASAKRRTIPWSRYAAVAACGALLAAAIPAAGMVRDNMKWRVIGDSFTTDTIREVTQPHSYEVMDGTACWPEDDITTESSADTGAGDQDQDMTPGELTDNMLEAGFSQEDVDGYLASGWQMTWAKWWKFYHLAEISGEWNLEALLDFSRTERLTVNTGEAPELPGGAPAGVCPDQGEAVMAYQNLMARFEADYGPGVYPEWYGGAYIDGQTLIVNIVTYLDPGNEGDKTLYFQIQEWAGSDRVGFGGSDVSLNQLKELQDKVMAAMEELGLAAGCGIDEEAGRVVLTLPEVTEEALWKLAWLDPADTAIQVITARMTVTDTPAEEPGQIAPSVSNIIQPGGVSDDPSMPVSNTDGMIVDGDGVIAYEPQG
ncbi:MAG: hypothetical protein HFF69_07730 [Oscillospiraceae bacterium]|jgi:hypothetical protein|nr:hypothetical protein [Oscillospiraceae bacterium]